MVNATESFGSDEEGPPTNHEREDPDNYMSSPEVPESGRDGEPGTQAPLR